MTTESQNKWAQYLETATQKEIREMAEYAIDHIEKRDQLSELQLYIALAVTSLSK